MHYRYVFHSLAVATLLIAADSAYAAAPVSQLREEQLPHVCKGGPRKGLPCIDDAGCPNSKCEISFLSGPDATFEAEVTLIVDDDVSEFDGTEEVSGVIAATVLLEIKDKGETHFLAQTYQNLKGHDFKALTDALRAGPFLADTGSPVSNRRAAEFRLNEALTDDPFPSILDDFLFEEGDSEMADAVRALFGVTGRPVVVDVPKDASFVERSDHVADGLASLVRLKVKVRFVAP